VRGLIAPGEDFLSALNTPLVPSGLPEHMIGATVSLASDASAWLTGQVLFVDGGFSAGLVWPIDTENQKFCYIRQHRRAAEA
jgi:NAD(P)-dependent dehydrogenase (short-subunit alcohol dehydrogenase family)